MAFRVFHPPLGFFLCYSDYGKYKWRKGAGKLWKRRSDLAQTINVNPEVFSDPEIVIIQYDLIEVSRQSPSDWRIHK